MQEADHPAVRVPADHEYRVTVPEPGQAIEFHGEALPRTAAQPGALDRGQLRPDGGRQVAGHGHLGPVPLAFDPVHGLAGGPHAPAVKGEALDVDDRFVTVAERAHAQIPVEVEKLAGSAYDRGAPARGPRVGQEGGQGRSCLPGGPDRIAADQRDAADHTVGDERAAGHEPFLVGPQREWRQRVGTPPAHYNRGLAAADRPGEQPLPPRA